MKNYGLVKFSVILLSISIAIPGQAAEYEAAIKFAHRITMSLPVTGQVDVINVHPGQNFKQGQTLLALDLTPFNSEVAQSQSQLTKSSADFKEADRDYNHLKELYDRGVLSNVELENGQFKQQQAKADLEAAEAKLAQAKYDLAHARIVAPFNGWVLDVNINQSETTNNNLQSQPLLVVAEADKYIARILVPISAVRKYKIGHSGSIVIGTSKFSGSVVAIGIEPIPAKNDSQLYAIDLKFNSNGLLLRPGQKGKISL